MDAKKGKAIFAKPHNRDNKTHQKRVLFANTILQSSDIILRKNDIYY